MCLAILIKFNTARLSETVNNRLNEFFVEPSGRFGGIKQKYGATQSVIIIYLQSFLEPIA